MQTGPTFCPHCGARCAVPAGSALARCRRCYADFVVPAFRPEPEQREPQRARRPSLLPRPPSARPLVPLWAFIVVVTAFAGTLAEVHFSLLRGHFEVGKFVAGVIGGGIVCFGGGAVLAVACRIARVRSSRGLRTAFAIGTIGVALLAIYGRMPQEKTAPTATPATAPATAPAGGAGARDDEPLELPDVELVR